MNCIKSVASSSPYLQNTLWPELHKLYGHGYEVYQCAASPDGRILASSCRATQLQFAAVILWEAGTWTKLAELQYHTLTVTRYSIRHFLGLKMCFVIALKSLLLLMIVTKSAEVVSLQNRVS